jgi:hypothetical protein
MAGSGATTTSARMIFGGRRVSPRSDPAHPRGRPAEVAAADPPRAARVRDLARVLENRQAWY